MNDKFQIRVLQMVIDDLVEKYSIPKEDIINSINEVSKKIRNDLSKLAQDGDLNEK